LTSRLGVVSEGIRLKHARCLQTLFPAARSMTLRILLASSLMPATPRLREHTTPYFM
jgi:hypothetical protein